MSDEAPRPQQAGTANRIDQVCDEFESRFRNGDAPVIEAFLAGSSAEDRLRLLRELLALELELRIRNGDQPSLTEYTSRFPEMSPMIGQLFSDLKSTASTFGRTAGGAATSQSATKPPSNGGDTLNLAGTTLGDYTLLKELGRGGMGIVYLAHQISLDRVVALKVIRKGENISKEELHRFRREAQAAARLDHPGIIPIYGFDEVEGQPYFVMAYVDGESLCDRIKEQPYNVREAVELTSRIADAVAYAHERGVVHRDLKPDNVLMTAAGQPRIADFGLAYHVEDPMRITESGQILGTPAYMSPEQAEGRMEAIGPASDVYSLGTVLYELLAGRPPFVGRSVLSVLQKVMHDPPDPLRSLNPNVDSALEAICLRSLAKSPADRFPTAREFQRDLDEWLSKGTESPGKLTDSTLSRSWGKQGLVLAAMVAVAVLLFLARPWESSRVETATGAQSEKMADSAEVTTPHETAKLEEPKFEAVRNVQAESPRVLLGHEDHVRSLQFTADGSRLLSSCTEGTWRIWDMSTGEPIATYFAPSGCIFVAEFTVDYKQCLTGSLKGIIRLWNVDDGTLVREYKGHVNTVWDIAVLPSGSEFISVGEDGTIRIWDINSGEQLASFEDPEGPVFSVDLHPSSQLAATAGADGTIRFWHLGTRSLWKAYPRIPNWIWSVAFTTDGETLFSDDGMQVIVWNATLGNMRYRWPGHNHLLYAVQPSPGGTYVLSGGRDDQVIMRDAKTGKLIEQFNGLSGEILSLAITPDSRTFASGGQNGNIRIWTVPEAVAVQDRVESDAE